MAEAAAVSASLAGEKKVRRESMDGVRHRGRPTAAVEKARTELGVAAGRDFAANASLGNMK